jgi:hypothetical protein
MPFTFFHPAIILPLTTLRRRWFSSTGLIIGSLTPDFEYFIRMKVQSKYSHTLHGLLWFDLPLGILLCFIYHNLIRNAFIHNSPTFLKKRLLAFNSFDWTDYFRSNYLGVIVSILLGAFSHLFWDSFTHEGAFFVTRLSFLEISLAFGKYRFPVYKICQHLSSAFGALVIIAAIITLKQYPVNSEKRIYIYWLLIILITLLIVILRLASGLNLNQYGTLSVTGISGGIFALIVTSQLLKGE